MATSDDYTRIRVTAIRAGMFLRSANIPCLVERVSPANDSRHTNVTFWRNGELQEREMLNVHFVHVKSEEN